MLLVKKDLHNKRYRIRNTAGIKLHQFRRISGVFTDCQVSAAEACDSLRCSRHVRTLSAAFCTCVRKLPRYPSDRPVQFKTVHRSLDPLDHH